MENYETYEKKVKFITGATAEEVDQKATEFQKTHNVFDIKQRSGNIMILFYWGKEEDERGNS